MLAVALSDMFAEPVLIIDSAPILTHLDVIDKLAAQASAHTGIPSSIVAEMLWERECLGSTGIGYGVALPHARINGLHSTMGIFVRLSSPIDFAAVDDKPVDLVFSVLSSADSGGDHLRVLGAVSQIFRDDIFREKLRAAKDEVELNKIFYSNKICGAVSNTKNYHQAA